MFQNVNEKLDLNLLHEKATVFIGDDFLNRNILPRTTLKEVCMVACANSEFTLQYARSPTSFHSDD